MRLLLRGQAAARRPRRQSVAVGRTVGARHRPRRLRLDPRRRRARLPLAGVVVLAVDDHHDARQVVRLMLEPLGARVLLAESGEHALQILDGERPHIILLDILMPGMDGLAFFREVQRDADRARIPILAVTALGGLGDYIRTWTVGFAGHLTKPVEQDDLRLAIRRVLGAT
jgi:two-component system response regulator GlrR